VPVERFIWHRLARHSFIHMAANISSVIIFMYSYDDNDNDYYYVYKYA